MWAANLENFDDNQIYQGLVELRKERGKYMPNAPTVADIFRRVNAPARSDAEVRKRGQSDPAWRSASLLWQGYNLHMMLKRKQTITMAMTEECAAIGKEASNTYRQAWSTESDKTDDLWERLMADMGNALIRKWNKACRIELQVNDVEQIFRRV